MSAPSLLETHHTDEWAEQYRDRFPGADRWAAGYGPIEHETTTQIRIFELADRLALAHGDRQRQRLFQRLQALDRITSAGLWLVVHEVYARNRLNRK